MPELFRVDRTHALPPGTEVVDRGGKPHARIKDGGRWALFPLTKAGTGYLRPSPTWCAEVRDADGTRRRVRLSPVKAAAQAMLTKLLREAEEGKAGIRSKLTGAGRLVLCDLLAEYKRHHLHRGSTAKHAARAATRCRDAFDACGMLTLADLDPTPVERWLAGRRDKPRADGGIGPQTSNHSTAALKAFGNFLMKTDRALANPFRHLTALNVDTDIRHARRAFDADEFDRLLGAARAAGEFRGLSGVERAMLYLTAGMTGLRASELASLTPASFDLDAATPVVAVEAAYSKRRRRDTVPLHPSLVVAMRPFLASRPAGLRVWPGKWAQKCEAYRLLGRDLAAARAAWVDEAGGPDERARRESSDFLRYKNSRGEFADFHSLRHRFVTELVNAGVMPKEAKELARHSTITLTMDRYAHATLEGTAAALGRLAAPGAGPRVAPGVADPAHGCRPVTMPDEVSVAQAAPRGAAESLGTMGDDGLCGRLKTHDGGASPRAPYGTLGGEQHPLDARDAQRREFAHDCAVAEVDEQRGVPVTDDVGVAGVGDAEHAGGDFGGRHGDVPGRGEGVGSALWSARTGTHKGMPLQFTCGRGQTPAVISVSAAATASMSASVLNGPGLTRTRPSGKLP